MLVMVIRNVRVFHIVTFLSYQQTTDTILSVAAGVSSLCGYKYISFESVQGLHITETSNYNTVFKCL